jgi:hypothetical protein
LGSTVQGFTRPTVGVANQVSVMYISVEEPGTRLIRAGNECDGVIPINTS